MPQQKTNNTEEIMFLAERSARAPEARMSAIVGVFLASTLLTPMNAAAQGSRTGIDPETWTPEYVRSIAGTETVDTAAECSKIVPLDHTGSVSYWFAGPTEAEPQIKRQIYADFEAAFAETYPNITVDYQNIGYNDLLNKLRTAALGNAAPTIARLPILWGSELEVRERTALAG